MRWHPLRDLFFVIMRLTDRNQEDLEMRKHSPQPTHCIAIRQPDRTQVSYMRFSEVNFISVNVISVNLLL